MARASSKRVDASVAADDIYRPPPTSIAVFDINTIEEPRLITTTTVHNTTDNQDKQEQAEDEVKKPAHVAIAILDKIETFELGPQLSWSEVRKAPQDEIEKPQAMIPAKKKDQDPPPPRKSTSFHSVRDIDTVAAPPPLPELTGRRPMKENSFILRDRRERENSKTAKVGRAKWRRPNPLEGPETQTGWCSTRRRWGGRCSGRSRTASGRGGWWASGRVAARGVHEGGEGARRRQRGHRAGAVCDWEVWGVWSLCHAWVRCELQSVMRMGLSCAHCVISLGFVFS